MSTLSLKCNLQALYKLCADFSVQNNQLYTMPDNSQSHAAAPLL